MIDPDAHVLAAISAELGKARHSMPAVRMATAPEEIIQRATRRRRRHRVTIATISLGLVISGAALVPTIVNHQAAQVSSTKHGQGPLRIETDAWSVVRDSSGIVTLTIHQARNADSLRSALEEAGVPSVVLFQKVCPYPSAGQPQVAAVFPEIKRNAAGVWLRIRPSAMPPGTKILVGFQANGDAVLRLHPRPGLGKTTFIELVLDSSAALATPINGHCSR